MTGTTPVSAKALQENHPGAVTTEAVYKRRDELVAAVNEEIQRLPLAGEWRVALKHDAAIDPNSLEGRAGLRAAIVFDDMPEYSAKVDSRRTASLLVTQSSP